MSRTIPLSDSHLAMTELFRLLARCEEYDVMSMDLDIDPRVTVTTAGGPIMRVGHAELVLRDRTRRFTQRVAARGEIRQLQDGGWALHKGELNWAGRMTFLDFENGSPEGGCGFGLLDAYQQLENVAREALIAHGANSYFIEVLGQVVPIHRMIVAEPYVSWQMQHPCWRVKFSLSRTKHMGHCVTVYLRDRLGRRLEERYELDGIVLEWGGHSVNYNIPR